MPGKPSSCSIDRLQRRGCPQKPLAPAACSYGQSQHERQLQQQQQQQHYHQQLQRQEHRQHPPPPPRRCQFNTDDDDEDDEEDDDDDEEEDDDEEDDRAEAHENDEDNGRMRQHQCQRHRMMYQHQQQQQRPRCCAGPVGDTYCPRIRSVSLDGGMELEATERQPQRQPLQQQQLYGRPPLKHQYENPQSRNSRMRRCRDPSPVQSVSGGGGPQLSSDVNSCGSVNNSGWCDDPTYECRSRLRGRNVTSQMPPPPLLQQQQMMQHTPPQQQQQNAQGFNWPPVRQNHQQQQQQQQQQLQQQCQPPPSCRRHVGRKYPDQEQARIYTGTSSHASSCEPRGAAGVGGNPGNAASWGGGGGNGACGGGNGACGGSSSTRCRHQVQLLIQVIDCGCSSMTDDQSCEVTQQLHPSLPSPQQLPPALPPPPPQQQPPQPQRNRVKCRPVWGSDDFQADCQEDPRDNGGAGGPSSQVHRMTIPCCCRIKQPSRCGVHD